MGSKNMLKFLFIILVVSILCKDIRKVNAEKQKWANSILPRIDYRLLTIQNCLSYVIDMNINRRQTAVLLSRTFIEEEINFCIRKLTKSSAVLILDHSTNKKKIIFENNFSHMNYTVDHKLGRLSFYIMYATSIEDLRDIIYSLSKLSIFQSRTNYIVIMNFPEYEKEGDYINEVEKNIDYLREGFSLLWHLNIFNSIIIYCTDNEFSCKIYHWFPFDKGSKCGRNKTNYALLDTCEYSPTDDSLTVNYINGGRIKYTGDINIIGSRAPKFHINASFNDMRMKSKYFVRKFFNQDPRGLFEFRKRHTNKEQEIYPDMYYYQKNIPRLVKVHHFHFYQKLPNNFNGCRFKCVIFVWPPFVTTYETAWVGIEHKMFLDIARFLNFRIKEIFPSPNGRREINDDLKMEFFTNNSAQMAFGNLYPIIEHHTNIDYSIGYLYDDVLWVVPRAQLKPIWLNLLYTFNTFIWIIVVVAFIIFTFLYTWISKINTNRPLDTAVMDCVIVAASSNIQNIPSNQIIRFFLMFWILYCFHVQLMYEVRLTTILTHPLRGKQIDTPDEIVSEKIAFGFSSTFVVHFERVNTTRANYFLKKMQQCHFKTCMERLNDPKPFATVGNRMYVHHSMAFGDVGSRVFIIPHPITSSSVEMYMEKGFPLRDKMNFFIRRMVEIGYRKGSMDIYFGLTINVSSDNINKLREGEFLDLKHFLGAFLFLAVGLLFAGIAFIFEFSPLIRARTLNFFQKLFKCFIRKPH